MSGVTKSKLTGFEDFDYLLKNLGPRVGNRVLQSAVTSAIRAGAREIKANVPRHTGKQSDASQTYGEGRKNIRVIRLKKVKSGERAARVDTKNAFWLLFYELGTRYQPARGFFAKAFTSAQGAILEILKQKIGTGIEKEAVKLRGRLK